MPLIKKGITAAGKALFTSGKKHLVRSLPNIAKDVTTAVVRDAQRGRRITPQTVAQRMGASIARNVGSPRRVNAAVVRPVRGLRSNMFRYLAPGRYRTRAGRRVFVNRTGTVIVR
jgi:hypothetical protein